MDDAVLVRRFERLRNLSRDRQRFVQWNRTARDSLREIFPLNQFKDQRGHAVRFFQAVDVRDVWVVKRGEDLSFATETRQPIGIVRDAREQHFNRDIAVQLGIACAIHLAHAAGADRSDDLIWAEPRVGRESQSRVDYTGGVRNSIAISGARAEGPSNSR